MRAPGQLLLAALFLGASHALVPAASRATAAAGAATKPKPFAALLARSPASPTGLTMASGDASSTPEPWTAARRHNTAAFRAAALVGAAAAAAWRLPAAGLLPRQGLAALHLLAFGTWLGSVVYTTFVAGITLFKNLPRQTFGKVQAKLFPQYFAIGSICLLLQLGTLGAVTRLAAARSSQTALVVALGATLLNQFGLEPAATGNMLERYRLEDAGQDKSDEYGRLKKSFGALHGLSSLANLVALCGGVAHAVYLAAALAA